MALGCLGLVLGPNQGGVLTLPFLRLSWLWLTQWGQVLVALCVPCLPVNISAPPSLGPGGSLSLVFPECPKARLKLVRELYSRSPTPPSTGLLRTDPVPEAGAGGGSCLVIWEGSKCQLYSGWHTQGPVVSGN